MTLETLLYNIGQIALKNNLVNAYFAGGSLYEINAEVVNEYPILFLTPAGDHTIKENTTRYSLTIYYADRLWDDDRNETDIVSTAIETLKNIKRQLPYLDWVAAVQEEPIIRLFTETEKMNDRLAGAYMQVWVETLNASVCAEFLDELGRPLGNYIPGNLNVLDGFATKAWVIMQRYADKPWVLEQIANIQLSGGTTVRQVLEMIASALTEYTKTENFATINNSAITEGGNFELADKNDLAELSGVTAQEIQEIYEAIALLSGATYIEQISAATYNNEENINLLSASTENIINDIHNLSAYTSGISESLVELSGATVSGFSEVYSAISVTETLISGNTQLINELSGATVSGLSSLTVDITTLSAVTTGLLNGQAVVYDFSEWTGKTNDGKTAMRAKWQADYNAGKKVYMKAVTTGNETVYLLLEKCESYDQFRYASDAYVCHLSISNTSAVGQSGGKVSKTDIITKSNLATKSATGIVKIGDGISVSQGTISADLRSDDVTFIWTGTQAQYDALSAVSNTTLYVIKSA